MSFKSRDNDDEQLNKDIETIINALAEFYPLNIQAKVLFGDDLWEHTDEYRAQFHIFLGAIYRHCNGEEEEGDTDILNRGFSEEDFGDKIDGITNTVLRLVEKWQING